jgi:hypothetical protein
MDRGEALMRPYLFFLFRLAALGFSHRGLAALLVYAQPQLSGATAGSAHVVTGAPTGGDTQDRARPYGLFLQLWLVVALGQVRCQC